LCKNKINGMSLVVSTFAISLLFSHMGVECLCSLWKVKDAGSDRGKADETREPQETCPVKAVLIKILQRQTGT
jgi:hypothetical protein